MDGSQCFPRTGNSRSLEKRKKKQKIMKIDSIFRPEDEKRSLSGHVWNGGESESDSLVADVDDNRGYNEDGSFVSE